ncbi:MAG: class I SAM-dependent methyltransferase, partial [Microcoleaceae cyanobacterium]
MEILDFYVKSAPSVQNAIDIFKGEWASKLPNELSSQCVAGITPLFEDMRINWAVKQIGGVAGKTVLELGPLEAGHTYMMEKLGASAITSVESNTRAYIKCLIIKELLELKRARFLSGDFVEYLKTFPGKFDFGIASGVLYHMIDPVELIYLLSESCNQIYIWTHYYDQMIIE